MNLFTLSAVLELDKSSFNDGIDEAKKSAGEVGEAMDGASEKTGGIGSAWESVSGKLATVGTLAGLTAVIDKAWQAATEIANMGDEIDKMSTRLGMTAEQYQTWKTVFSYADLDLAGSTRAFNSFFKTLAEGSDDAVDGLAQLGINYDEFMQLGTSDQMYQIVAGFQALAASGVDVRGLAQTFFGTTAGTNMLTLLAGTGFADQYADAMGLTAGQGSVSASATFNDALTRFNTLLDSIKLDAFAPILESLASAITEMTDFLLTITGRKNATAQEQVAAAASVTERQAAAAGVELEAKDLITEMGGDVFAAQQQAVLDLYYAMRGSGQTSSMAYSTVAGLIPDGELQQMLTAAQISEIAGTYFGTDSGVLNALATLQATYDASADAAATEAEAANGASSSLDSVAGSAATAAAALAGVGAGDGTFAIGTSYIPFDGYRAVLHRGEMVLTAAQAAAYRNGDNGGGYAIGSLADAMSRVSVRMDGKTVGNMVTQTVSENINNAANRGRYAW